MSNFRFSKKIASRYLWSRRSEAFITIVTVAAIIGVALGVIVINVVMAIMTGFQHELRDKIINADSHIVIKPLGGRLQDWQRIVMAVSQIPEVVSVGPYTYHQALLRTKSSAAGLLVRGVAPKTAPADQLQSFMDPGFDLNKLFSPEPVMAADQNGKEQEVSLPGMIIGRELARSHGLFVGSVVSLLSPQTTSSPFGLVPRFRRFVVVGIYASGLTEYEGGLAYVSLAEAQAFFLMGEAISGLELRIKDIEQTSTVREHIVKEIGGIRSGLIVDDWTERNKPLWDALKLEKKVYFIVLLLIILMASFSIVTTLVMIVLEKRKDIAVLRTLGATTSSIANIFRIQGAVIGAIGTSLGLLGGYLACVSLRSYGFPLDERIFQMTTVPVRMEWQNFAVTGAAAFIICFLATIYPARRASQLDPSGVLRYE